MLEILEDCGALKATTNPNPAPLLTESTQRRTVNDLTEKEVFLFLGVNTIYLRLFCVFVCLFVFTQYLAFNKKLWDTQKSKRNHHNLINREGNQQNHSKVTQMLELPDMEFKNHMTMINILKNLKTWTICRNWWIIWEELEIIYKKEKVKVLEIKYCIGDQKFLQQASQHSGYRRISEFEHRNYPNWTQRKKSGKNTKHPRGAGQYPTV